MKLLDANIFFYAMGASHPHKTACARLLTDALVAPNLYTTNTEVIQEILHVYNRRSQRATALQVAEKILTLFPHTLAITLNEMHEAINLMKRYTLSPRDALHAATVITYNLEGIVTTDIAFTNVNEIKVFSP